MTGVSRDVTTIRDGEWTLADIEAVPRDGHRREIVDGYLIVAPMVRRRHQLASVLLGKLLEAACPPQWWVFPLPIDVDETPRTHLEPDLTVVRRAFVEIDNGDIPLLAVEVRSPSTAGVDAGRKRRAYARIGIPSYWLVDADRPSIRALELDPALGEYVETGYAEGGQALTVQRPFPVTIVPASLRFSQ